MRERYGPWALIAGGSEGLGTAFARGLAAEGINLFLIARRGETLDRAAAELRATYGVEVRTLATDLSASDALAKIGEEVQDIEIGTLIWNAGAAERPALVVEQDVGAADTLLAINVLAPTGFARHFGERMARRGRGAILFVSSLGSIAGSKRLAIYAAAKAYLQIFAEGLWAELSPSGVDVAALMIGRTRTPALERSEYGKETAVPAAEPADVARFALDNLGEGPVLVPPELEQAFSAMRAMPRAKAVKAMTRSLESQTA